jgi:hypothetical protein
MAFMQGPGLLLLAPLIASFFLGGAWLSRAFARAGVVSRWNARLYRRRSASRWPAARWRRRASSRPGPWASPRWQS